jgi:hypothetical protein
MIMLFLALGLLFMACRTSAPLGVPQPLGIPTASGVPTPPGSRIFHVDPEGDDLAGSGAEGAPWQTIQQCAEEAGPGDTCLIHAGVYPETVRPARSGEPGAPITFVAAPDEAVVISGADPLPDWQPVDGNRFQTTVPSTLGQGKDQLFLDGEALVEARHPNRPDPQWVYPVADLSPLWPARANVAANSLGTSDNDQYRLTAEGSLLDQPLNTWPGAMYIGWHYWGWAAQTGVVASSAPGELNVDPATTSFNWWCSFALCYASWSPDDGRGLLAGHPAALDEPGEWILNSETGVLEVLLPGDVIPQDHRLEWKQRHLAFDLSDRAHITVEEISVFAASITTARSGFIRLDGLALRYVSHFTLFADGRNGYIDPVPNPSGLQPGDATVLPRGEVGLYLGGHDNILQNSTIQISAGAGVILQGDHHLVHNNLIEECSYGGTYLSCIYITYDPANDPERDDSRGRHTITYNTLRNAGRSLLHVNGLPAIAESRGAAIQYDAMRIQHNHLFNGNLLSRDTGNVYAWAVSMGQDGQLTDFAFNVIHDSWGSPEDIGLVYWDNATFAIDNHHNLLWGSPGSQQTDHTFNPPGDERTWRDTVWKPNYSGGEAGLTDADFPGGRFAYGHNFEKPPSSDPIPAATALPLTPDIRLQAEDFDMSAGVVLDGDRVGQCDNGDWLAFRDVYFSDGYQRWRTRLMVPSTNAGNTIEMRLDTLDGPLVGSLVTQAPAEPLTFSYQEVGLSGVRGTHDVYFVCVGDGRIGVFDWFLFSGGSGPTATPSPQPLNLALGRPATASTYEGGGFEAAGAVDGRRDTRWASVAFEDPQWIQVDLGQVYLLERLLLYWETAYARAYDVQVSDSPDGPWTTVYSQARGDGGLDDIQGLSARGRYVRLLGTGRGSPWGYSLWEIELYDADNAPLVEPANPQDS